MIASRFRFTFIRKFRKLSLILAAIVIGLPLLYGVAVGYSAGVNFITSRYVFHDKGPIINQDGLPKPLYPAINSVTLFSEPNESVVGVMRRTVIYPVAESHGWITGLVYFWVWNADVTSGLGQASVISHVADMNESANGLTVGTLNGGTKLEKLYLNRKRSWALCEIRVAVQRDDLRTKDGSGFLSEQYPVITLTTREAGDVQANSTAKTISDSGPLLIFIPFAFLSLIIAWVVGRRRRVMTKNNITMSGVTSSSINVQSPFGSALLAIDREGGSETAVALLKLTELIENSNLDPAKRKESLELLEAFAAEAKSHEPRKATLRAISRELAISIAGSVIVDQATPLLDVLHRLWQ